MCERRKGEAHRRAGLRRRRYERGKKEGTGAGREGARAANTAVARAGGRVCGVGVSSLTNQ